MDRSRALRLLGLREGATVEEIRAAFRREVSRHHPDHDPDPTAAERTRLLLQARRLLVDERLTSDGGERGETLPSAFLEACSRIGRVVRHDETRGTIWIETYGPPGCVLRVGITALDEDTWLLDAECHLPGADSTVDLRRLLDPVFDAMRRRAGARR